MIKGKKNIYTIECDGQNCDNYLEHYNDDPYETVRFKELLAYMEDYDWTYWKDDFGEWKHFCPSCNFVKKIKWDEDTGY